MEFSAGQIVFSKCGHDQGDLLVILSVEGDYVYLVDGKRRLLAKPKRKKKKHVQPTKYIDNTLQAAFLEQQALLDSDIRKAIKEYQQ